MIIACPACKRRYVVKRNSIPDDGQVVRCMACGNQWTQKPVEKMTETERAAHERVQPANENNGLGSRSAGRSIGSGDDPQNGTPRIILNIVKSKLFIVFIIILSIFSTGYSARDYIIKSWPKSEPIFKLFGIEKPINKASLEIKVRRINLKKSRGTLNIEGIVINNADKAIPLGELSIDGYGKCHNLNLWEKAISKTRNHRTKGKQCVLRTWKHSLKNRILPKEKYDFTIKIDDLTKGIESVVVRF